jgi:hypothetical protein
MLAEIFDDLTGLVSVQEQLHIQAFIAKFSVEGFREGVLPRAARLDIEGCNALVRQPLLQGLGDELGTVVTAQEPRGAVLCDQEFQHSDHLTGIERAGNLNGQALTGKLIDDRQQPQLLPVEAGIFEKVVGPNVVGELCLLGD